MDAIQVADSITKLGSQSRGTVLVAASHGGRGVRLMLSRQFYRYIGKAGTYTRKRGLDRETNKELLLKHIRGNRRHPICVNGTFLSILFSKNFPKYR